MKRFPIPSWRGVASLACVLALGGLPALCVRAPHEAPKSPSVDARLVGLDAAMEKILKDWNAPGVAVGLVVKDRLVFAKGYGYRDVARKLPMTPKTLVQVASNSKLFTAVGAGMLVEEGKLEWDKPVRTFVPTIQFFNDDLNRSVTLRDMLAHRTGITRHDLIWYKSDFTRRELFERLKHLEPSTAPRQTYLYNNLMYAAVGHIIQLVSGASWEDFTRDRIFRPLGMDATVFKLSDMRANPDHGVPYAERRDSSELFQLPFYEEQDGVAPAAAIISNVEDMSRWLIALMNDGRFQGRQVLPAKALKATLAPAMPQVNTDLENFGYRELLNPVYGMGRNTAVYRGHTLASHGGALGGFYSQVSYLPQDGIGVIVLVDGGHCGPLPDVVSYGIYERMLGLDPTPWSERRNGFRLKNKRANQAARGLAGGDRIMATKPSHALADFAGEFEHPAYGLLRVAHKEGGLRIGFRKANLPLNHYHFDRFDTPNDEIHGQLSVNFQINPQGEVDRALMSLDQAEVTFVRRADAVMSDPGNQARLSGTYEYPNGVKFQITAKDGGRLALVAAGGAETLLEPVRPWIYRLKAFSDVRYEFTFEEGKVSALRISNPTGVYICLRR